MTEKYATRRRRTLAITLRTALLVLGILAGSTSALADEGKWTFQLEPMYMDAYGHDQHVLNIHRIDLASTPRRNDKRAVSLDTEAGPAYRSELQYVRNQWGWGLDYFWFATSQAAPSPTAAAAGPSTPVVFEVADRSFTSSGPAETLFYNVLEDTDLNAWTVDLYAIRTLAEKPKSNIHLQFGLRVGDFDNDYRAVVGIQGIAGRRLDGSSNYGLMMGPIVGLAGDARWGRSRIKGYLGQSVILGSAELSGRTRELAGPFVDPPAYVTDESFRAEMDVAIPITELRIKWTFRATDLLSFGVGANASSWWDVPVPPGVIPVEDGAESLHENTIVFFGMLAAVELTF